jgi:UDP-N-acetylenolpyruvoylglucosamine reductase
MIIAHAFLLVVLQLASCEKQSTSFFANLQDVDVKKIEDKMRSFTHSPDVHTNSERHLKGKPQPKLIDPCTKMVADQLGWTNWEEIISTNAAVFRPTSDDQLSKILTAASKKGCTVRISGATHSSDGLVMQRAESNIVLVSLADHQISNSAWRNRLDSDNNRVRIGAGQSLYQLLALIRPQGYLLPTRTSGRYFTVGGIVSNMVHGGGQGAGFLQEYVTSFLVMLANGQIKEISSEEELLYWRSSAGLLGIILGVELQVVRDTGFAMKLDTIDYNLNDPTFIAQFVSDVYTKAAIYTHSEFFFNAYTGNLVVIGADNSGPIPDTPTLSGYSTAYETLIEEAGDVSFSGGPKISIPNACAIIPEPYCFDPQATAYLLAMVSNSIVQQDVSQSSGTVNDGFYSTTTAPFHAVDLFAPASNLVQMVGTFLGVFQQFVSSSSPYFPSGSLQFRFVNPSPKAGILNPIPPIADIQSDFLARNFFPLPSTLGSPEGYVALHYTGISGINDDFSSIFLQQLESAWTSTPLDPTNPAGPTNPLIPVKAVHLGKMWGYGATPDLFRPYSAFRSQSLIDQVYTVGKSTSIADFNSKRLSLDPSGLFAGGAMMRWLDPSGYPNSVFEPRSLVGQECNTVPPAYADNQCTSICCGDTSGVCLDSGFKSGQSCVEGCQCLSGVCASRVNSKPKPGPASKPVCA